MGGSLEIGVTVNHEKPICTSHNELQAFLFWHIRCVTSCCQINSSNLATTRLGFRDDFWKGSGLDVEHLQVLI